ncbi:MAG TPA: methyltransferase domain-containing protein [Terriglobales bacterium]|jgi:ubiquinone/menaquinone biosynthesis C-methylase UbiE|nr:methyltransferase domain-containing protein [Terriglobales bacterium]
MISRSDDYVEYCRETARQTRDLHDLALRGRDKKHITRLIHERIVDAVELGPGDDLIDIGCGDGILLRLAEARGVRSALGLLATEEEVALVRKTGLNVRQGFTDRLPLPDGSASVVVCNNVLLVVPRKKIPASLHEIYRVARPGARIFIGEIPFVDPKDPTPHFSSRREALSWMYRERGLRTWFGMLRRMAWWQVTGKPAVILPGTSISFFSGPEEFSALSSEAGLELVRYWQHSYPDNRNNYLLRKPNLD